MGLAKRPWTQEDNARLKEFAAQGASIIRAATALHRNIKSVRIQARNPVSRSRQCGFSAKSSQMCPPAPGASASFNPSNPLNKFKSPSSNLMESVRWIRSRRSPAFSRRPKIPRLRAVGRRSGNGPAHIGPDSGAETESPRLAKPNEEKIRKRAREIWEENNRPVGRDVEFWFQAEREFREAEDLTNEIRDDI